MNTNVVTIPQKIAAKGDLVVIPRKEYEALLVSRKIKEFVPTKAQKIALRKAEDNLRKGRTFSYNELVKKTGV